jgi:RNA polymerase sigma factor (sigma-70 family)
MFGAHMVYYWRVILPTIGTLIRTSEATLEKDLRAGNGIPLNNKTAAALIREIQERDVSALASLYDRTGSLFFGLILKILGDRTPAEESLLDIYTHIWSQAPSCDPGRSPLEWMLSIARARAIDRLHWLKRDRKKREFSSAGCDSKMTVAPELQELARSSLESLIPAQRQILDWIYYSGLSCSEIAAQTGKPPGAIRTHARLCLNKLSEIFRPLFDNGTEAKGVTSKCEETGEDVRELAAFYALGVLTQHEARSFETHLMTGCAACTSELRKFEQTAAGIGLAAEEIETPEYVRDLLLARIERELEVSISTASPKPKEGGLMAEPAPPLSPGSDSTFTPTPPKRSPMTEPLFSALSKPAPKRSMSHSTFWLLRGLLIALIVLCSIVLYYLISTKASYAQLQQQLSNSQENLNDLGILFDIQKINSDKLNQLLAAMGKPGARIIRLLGKPVAPSSPQSLLLGSEPRQCSGALLLDTEQHQCLLFGYFPPPPRDRTYQLWLFTRSKVRVSAGLIKVNPAGETFTTALLPMNALDVIAAGISLEPESGSSEPTMPFYVEGRYY